MSVIIRLQNLPWSANALDIRNFFRGLSIPEGGVHIVGGELGDAFIAFSTDEDARQAMMMDGGKVKEIQVKLLLSSRSEMHKVIEAARQSVPLLSLAAPAPAPIVPTPAPVPVAVPQPAPPVITPFSTALGNSIHGFGIPGIGNPQEIPQPAVIEPPAPIISPRSKSPNEEEKDGDEKSSKKRTKDRRRSRSRSRSRDRDRKDRKKDRRDRSRSRERRRRDRSRSRDRRDRKRDRKDRSRSRDRSPSRRSRDKRNDRRLSQNSQERSIDNNDSNSSPMPPAFSNANPKGPHMMFQKNMAINGPAAQTDGPNRFNDPSLAEAFNKLQELGKKRNPNAFQGDHNGGRFQGGRDGNNIGRGGTVRRDGRNSRFDEQEHKDCCVAIRNAPNHTSYGDVRRFFPFMIDKHGIKMINDNMGRRTGNIFVRFCDPRSKQLALQRKNNELKGSFVTVEALEDDTYESAVDSYLPYREENDDAELNNHIDNEPKTTEPFSVLKLTDLPTFVKEQEVMKAFSDFSLLSIQLSDCRMTRTKTAIVQFVKADDAKAAFDRKDTYMFGRRQPTITPIIDKEFENDNPSQDKLNKPLLDIRPTSDNSQEAVPRDPRQRRQPIDNGPGPGVMPGTMQQFIPNAQFPQNFGAPFPGPQFGGFPRPGIEPRAASNNWGNRMNFPKQPILGVPKGSPSISSPQTNIEDEPLDCVLMKGLPREATDRTIVNFLADTGAVPSRIHLMLDANSQPSGDCFCEFRSTQEARKAVTKHGQQLDGCRITVDLVMRSVVEEALEGPKNEPQPPILGNGPPQFMNAGPRGFMGPGQFRGRGMFDRGGFDRGGFRGFDHSRGGFRGRGMWSERGGWHERGMRGFDRGRGRGGFGRGRGGIGGFDHGNMPMPMPKNDEEPDSEIENFGAPGCVVSMENVPFRATVDDILAFFGDFELTQDDVIRRYNERGQPTGDARVAFRTPFDAQRAIKTRHMNHIQDRAITLNIL